MDKRLEQAVRTLRAIRQRHEEGRNAGSGYVRSYTVQVAFGYADMRWISAAIEALEIRLLLGDAVDPQQPGDEPRLSPDYTSSPLR